MKSRTALILASMLVASSIVSPAFAQQSAKERPCSKVPIEGDLLRAYCGGLGEIALRGMVIAGQNPWQEAIKSFDAALAIKPDFGLAFAGRGVAYYNLNDFNDAVNDFDRAIQLMPDDVDSFVNRAAAQDKLGHFDLALRDFSNAIALDPSFVKIYHMRASLFAAHKQYQSAISDYGQVLTLTAAAGAHDNPFEIRGTRQKAFYFRAYAEFDLKDYPATIADCDQALLIYQTDANALFLRGVAKIKSGDTADGQADIASAKAKKSDVQEGFAAFGVTP